MNKKKVPKSDRNNSRGTV